MNIKKFFNNIFNIYLSNIDKNLYSPLLILSILVFLTIFIHLVFWILNYTFTNNLWIHGSNPITLDKLLSPGIDGGYFEHFQYIILFWNFLLSIYVVIRSKLFAAFSVPIINLFLFLDDSLSIHDQFSPDKITSHFNNYFVGSNLANFIRLKDIIEISYWSLFLFIFLILSIPIIFTKSRHSKNFLKINILNYGILAFFGIGVDLFNANIIKYFNFDLFLQKFIYNIFFLIEECGELGVISLIFIWLFGLSCTNKYLLTKK